jgi:hypothetical protein
MFFTLLLSTQFSHTVYHLALRFILFMAIKTAMVGASYRTLEWFTERAGARLAVSWSVSETEQLKE